MVVHKVPLPLLVQLVLPHLPHPQLLLHPRPSWALLRELGFSFLLLVLALVDRIWDFPWASMMIHRHQISRRAWYLGHYNAYNIPEHFIRLHYSLYKGNHNALKLHIS